MFDSNYYNEKKKKLEQKFAINKDRVLGKVTAMLNEFWEEQRDIQENFKEIEETIKNKEPKKEAKEAKKDARKDKN